MAMDLVFGPGIPLGITICVRPYPVVAAAFAALVGR